MILIPLVMLSSCSSSRTAQGAPSVTEVSGRMPVLEGETLQGGKLRPSDHRGRVLVVNFWATWCAPCREEQPVLSSVEASGGETGPVFVGVDYRDDPAAARAYLREFGVSYPSLEDASGSLAYRFGVPFLPSTIVVDTSGQMRYKVVGAIDRATLEDLIRRVGG